MVPNIFLIIPDNLFHINDTNRIFQYSLFYNQECTLIKSIVSTISRKVDGYHYKNLERIEKYAIEVLRILIDEKLSTENRIKIFPWYTKSEPYKKLHVYRQQLSKLVHIELFKYFNILAIIMVTQPRLLDGIMLCTSSDDKQLTLLVKSI